MVSYSDVDVKCPFYQGIKKDNKYSYLNCEGVCFSDSLTLRFGKQSKREKHMTKYCCDNYEGCPVAKMLEEKWDTQVNKESK